MYCIDDYKGKRDRMVTIEGMHVSERDAVISKERTHKIVKHE